MAEEDYNSVMDRLQHYIPFLDNMIAQLKEPNKKNREQQLTKMESLHAMITDKRKKLKVETLIKCEDVLLKLYGKLHTNQQNKPSSSANIQPTQEPKEVRSQLPHTVTSTPASPSPDREIGKDKPVVIPTEKVERTAKNISTEDSSPKRTINIYRRAAETLHHGSKRESVFNRLGYHRYTDMSRPPISFEDLKSLESDECIDLRNKLNQKTDSPKHDLQNINTTVRNNTTPTKRPVTSVDRSRYKIDNRGINKDHFDIESNPKKDMNESNSPFQKDTINKINKDAFDIESKFKMESPNTPTISVKSDTSPQITPSPKLSPRVEKIIKDTDSIFGNLLSSLDNKILENKKRDKKDERRSSTSSREEKNSISEGSGNKKDERRNSREDKKSIPERNGTEKKITVQEDKKREKSLSKTKDSKSYNKEETHGEKEKKTDPKVDAHKNKDKSKEEKVNDKEKHKSKSHKHKHKSKDRSEKERSENEKELDRNKKKDEKKHGKVDKPSHVNTDTKKNYKLKNDRLTNEDFKVKGEKDEDMMDLVHLEEKAKNLRMILDENLKNIKKNPLIKEMTSTETTSSEHAKSEIACVPFKRLADKYNPKPRKPSGNIIDVDKVVKDSIEKSMKSCPPTKIPFLEDTSKKLEVTPLPLPFPAESNQFLKKPEVTPLPSPFPPDFNPLNISEGTIISNILSNPKSSAIIDDVVSKLAQTQKTFNAVTSIEPQLNLTTNINIDIRPVSKNMQFYNRNIQPTLKEIALNPSPHCNFQKNEMISSGPIKPLMPVSSALLPTPKIPPLLSPEIEKKPYGNTFHPVASNFGNMSTQQQNLNQPYRESLQNQNYEQNFAGTRSFNPFDVPATNPIHSPQFLPNTYSNFNQPQMPFQTAGSMTPNPYNNAGSMTPNSYSNAGSMTPNPYNNTYGVPQKTPYGGTYDGSSTPNPYNQERTGFPECHTPRDDYSYQNRRFPDENYGLSNDPRFPEHGKRWQADNKDPRLSRDPRIREKDVRETWNSHDNGNVTNFNRDPREYTGDIREMRSDPRDYYRDTRDKDLREVSRDPRDQMRDPRDNMIDPRESRDPREFNRDPRDNNRDPRNYRKDPREQRNDNRNATKDIRDGNYDTRDPRDRDRNYHDGHRDMDYRPAWERDVRSRFRDSRGSRQSKLDRRDRSSQRTERSISRNRTGEAFTSPLDSLYYSTDVTAKTGKGYGIQNYKVKKEKDSDLKSEAEKDTEKNNESSDDLIEVDAGKSSPITIHDDDDSAEEKKLEDGANSAQEKSVTPSRDLDAKPEESKDEAKNVGVCKETIPPKKPEENFHEIALKNKEKGTEKKDAETSESKQSNVKGEKTEGTSKPTNVTEQSILAQFFTNLLSSHNKKDKKGALLSLISTFADNFGEHQLRRITDILENSSDEEDTSKTEKEEHCDDDIPLSQIKKSNVKESVPENETKLDEKQAIGEDNENEAKSKIETSPRKDSPKSKKQKARRISDTEQSVESESSELTAENVIVSVGERTKNRKRKPTTSLPVQTKSRKRTELDKLHEDIQDMFIRDGVLTATGKRMCNMLRTDPAALEPKTKASKKSEDDTPKRKTRSSNKFEKAEDEDVSVMKNVVVVLPKMDISSKNDRYALRQISKKPSYVEPENLIITRDDEYLGEKMSIDDESAKQKKLPSKTAVTNKTSTPPEKTSNAEEVETPKEDETSVFEDNKQTKTMCKKRKPRSTWASGVIKKKKRKNSVTPDDKSITPSDSQSDVQKTDEKLEVEKGSKDESVDSNQKELALKIEPDTEYYFGYKTPMACKLCDFTSKSLALHYRNEHNDSEVLIARLSPLKAKKALELSKENDYDELQKDPNIDLLFRMNYCCIFCDLKMKNALTSQFYDHITTHTGEFRFSCKECSFHCHNRKTLSRHYENEHFEPNRKQFRLRKPLLPKVLCGYICIDCNYVQLDKQKVENHIKVSHPGNTEQILIINLSTEENQDSTDNLQGNDSSQQVEPSSTEEKMATKSLPDVGTENEEKNLHLANDQQNIITTNISEEDISKQTQSKPSPKPKTTGKKKAVKANKSKHDDSLESSPQSQSEKETSETVSKSSDSEEEMDMNVFTCATDIYEEEQKIEAERLKTMEEINKSVKKPRNTLDFIEKLSSKLTTDNTEKETEIPIKPEPVDVPEEEPCEVKVFDKNKPSSDSNNEQSGDILEILKNTEVPQKNNPMIDSMVQKLQGILQTEVTQCVKPSISSMSLDSNTSDEMDGLPPLIPLNNLNVRPSDDNTSILNTGLIKVIKNSTSLLYLCLVPPCVFSTEDQNSFAEHCKVAHMWLSYNCDKCEACGKKIVSNNVSPLLHDLLEHILKDHSDFISPTALARRPLLRARRLSGDKLSNRTDEESDPSTSQDSYRSNEDTSSHTLPKEISVAPEITEDNDDTEDNPFGFKIADVVSLADLNRPPKLSPLSNKFEGNSSTVVTSPQKQSVSSFSLCEVEMTALELTKPKKSPEAMSKFLNCSRDLYKCPIYSCKFTTNYSDMYSKHIQIHKVSLNILLPCVYCDWKTPLEDSAKHIEVRHGNCNYACPFCMYRALKKEFVSLHLEDKHKGKAKCWSIINLPQTKTQKKFLILTKPTTKYCKPYICPCGKEFLFGSEFMRHTDSCSPEPHKCMYEPCTKKGYAFSDYFNHIVQVHGIHPFQCSYCPSCFSSASAALQHHATKHPTLNEHIYSRGQAVSDGNYGYTDSGFKHLRVVNTSLYSRLSQVPLASEESLPKLQEIGSPANREELENVISSPLVVEATKEPPRILNFDMDFSSTMKLINEQSPKLRVKAKSILEKEVVREKDNPIKQIEFLPISCNNSDVAEASNVIEDPLLLPEFFDFQNNVNDPSLPNIETSETLTAISNLDLQTNSTVAVTLSSVDTPAADISSRTLRDKPKLRRSTSISGEDSDSRETDSVDEMSVKKVGLVGSQLYKCAICEQNFENSFTFKDHISFSINCKSSNSLSKPYMCIHCGRYFRNPTGLVSHIHYHGHSRFRCSLCNEKFAHSIQGKAHMKSRHNIQNILNVPLVPSKTELEMDEFVMKPRLHQTEQSKSKEVAPEDSSASGTLSKTSFLPSEVDQLPIRSIYSTEVKCAICLYATKVRTNLVRHLQLHVEEKDVPNSAPVNPVPCLDKNEKMFDKMTNLAISSFSSGASRMGVSKTEAKGEKEIKEDYPAYVPPHRRFVCGANDCNYLCLEESNLRHHLSALHGEETSFVCSHCKKQLPETDADGVLKHLKLHDLHLYKCSHCSYLHNLRHKIERHLIDHRAPNVKIITIRALDAPPPVEAAQQPDSMLPHQEQVITTLNSSKWIKPWRCGMCKYRSHTNEDMVAHVLSKHEIDSQYKCTLCTYKTNDDKTFSGHFKENHPGHSIDIIMVFHKTNEDKTYENDFDTTPLWLRDKPRVRHIRGILLDDSSPGSKRKGKSAPVTPSSSSTASTSSVDSAIDAVVKGTANVIKKQSSDAEDIFEKINKDLAESKEDIALAKQEHVINITDSEDEDDLIILDTKVPDPEIIDLDKVIETEKQDKPSSSETLIEKYGSLGSPLQMQFCCPKCNNFKTKKIIDFIYHIFRDLNYKRFECGACHIKGVTKKFILDHVKKHADLKDVGLSVLSTDNNIFCWVEMVIRHQSTVIASQNPAPLPVQSGTAKPENECRFCHDKFSSAIDTHLHEIRHWMDNSIHCGTCKFKCDLEEEMRNHSSIIHPEASSFKNHMSPTVENYIKMCEEGSNVTIELLKINQLTNSPPPQPPPPQKADVTSQYYCTYCYYKGDSVTVIEQHWIQEHQPRGLEFKVKKSKLVETSLLACEYCNVKGLEHELKIHHAVKHPEAEFKVYKFKCSLCSQSFRRIDYFRNHVRKAHNQPSLSYINIHGELIKQDNSTTYTCPICPHISPTSSAFRSHARLHCKTFMCKMCQTTFKFRHDAIQHFRRDHPHNPVSIELLKDKVKEYDDICFQVLGVRSSKKLLDETHPLDSDIVAPAGPSTSDIKLKNTARKSTCSSAKPEFQEYSFYGLKPEATDLRTVITTVEVNKSEITMTAQQLASLFNIEPTVLIEDCMETDDIPCIDDIEL